MKIVAALHLNCTALTWRNCRHTWSKRKKKAPREAFGVLSLTSTGKKGHVCRDSTGIRSSELFTDQLFANLMSLGRIRVGQPAPTSSECHKVEAPGFELMLHVGAVQSLARVLR